MEWSNSSQLSSDMQKSQNAMRKVLSNPLTLLIGLVYAILFVSYFYSFIEMTDTLGKTLTAISEEYNILSVVYILAIIAQIAFPVLFAIAFFAMFANSRNTTQLLIPKTGSKFLVFGSLVFVFYYVCYIILDLYMWSLYAKRGFLLEDGYVAVKIIVYLILIMSALFYILFALSLFKNLSEEVLESFGAIPFGICNIIFAVIYFVLIILEEQQTGTLVSSNGALNAILLCVINGLLGAFAFYYRATSKNAYIVNENAGGNLYNNQGVQSSNNQFSSVNSYEKNFCPSCGAKITVQGQSFCGSCGYKLN